MAKDSDRWCSTCGQGDFNHPKRNICKGSLLVGKRKGYKIRLRKRGGKYKPTEYDRMHDGWMRDLNARMGR